MTPNGGRRTIETGRARQCFGCNIAAEVVESAVDSRFGKRGKDLLSGDRSRRTARHGTDETALSDGSFPDFSVELFGSDADYVSRIGFTLRLCPVVSMLATPLRCLNASCFFDREQPPAIPATEQRARDIEVRAVSMQCDTNRINTTDLVALLAVAVAQYLSPLKGRKFVRRYHLAAFSVCFFPHTT